MSLFTYSRDIPNGPNNPSVDQPKMKINTNSTFDLISVDHKSFNENNGGYHTVIHQGPEGSDPAVTTGFGQTYTKTVTINTVADRQLFFQNDTDVFQLTPSPTIVSGTVALGIVFATFIAIPLNTRGILYLANGFGVPATIGFFTNNSTLFTHSFATTSAFFGAQGSSAIAQPSGLNLQLKTQFPDTFQYTYIYWTR